MAGQNSGDLGKIPRMDKNSAETPPPEDNHTSKQEAHKGQGDGKLAGGWENGGTERKDEAKKKKEKPAVVPYSKLFSFADRLDYLLMLLGTVGAIVVGVSQPAMTLLLGNTLDVFGTTQDTSKLQSALNSVLLKFLYLGIAAGVAGYMEVACWLVTAERQSARIRVAYLQAILRQDVEFFDKESATGEVVARLSGDTLFIQAAIGDHTGKFIHFMSTFVGGYVIAFIRGWKLTLVAVSTLPLMVAAGGIVAVLIQSKSKGSLDAFAEAAKVVEQILGSIRTVASFNGESKAVEDYDVALRKGYKVAVKKSAYGSWGLSAIFIVLYGSYALTLWYGAILVTEEGFSGGRTITVVFSTVIGGISLGQAAPAVTAIQLGQQAAFKMFEVMSRKPAIDSSRGDGEIISELKGDILFDKVHFHYPSRPGVQIFSDFTLSIPSSNTVALVGESGSGKSTVISLLERFYDPQLGQVLLDGRPLASLNVRWLRQQMGLVGQEPVLFAASIADNIAYGKEGASMEEIQAAAERANAAIFIGKFPKGYETQVGEHGAHLSGGQKQRVAIARAILNNPKILLLDEATSALDSRSEQIVQAALDHLMVGRTTIVVAHRLSTIRHADMIAVVQHGKIVETGTHMELVSHPEGAYTQLVKLQDLKGHERDDNEVDDNEIQSARIPTIPRASSVRSSGRLSGSSSLRRSLSKRQGSYHELDLEIGEGVRRNTSIWRLASLLDLDGKVLGIIGCIFAVLFGVATPVFAYLLSEVTTVYYNADPHKVRSRASFWACMFVVMAVFLALVTPGRNFTLALMGHKLEYVVRRSMFDKFVRQEISWFDGPENSSGAISARLSVDASLIQSLVGDTVGVTVGNMATLLGALVIALTANWQLALVVFAILPLFGFQGFGQMKRSQGLGRNAKKQHEGASQMACDAVGSIRTVASFCAESKVVREYQAVCAGPKKMGIKESLVTGAGLGFAQFALFSAYAISFWYGGKLVEDGKTSFSKVFKVFLAIAVSANTVATSVSLAPDLGKVRSAAASIFGVLDMESKIDPANKSGKTLPSVKGDVQLREVIFQYPSRPDVSVFRNLSLVIPAGKTVAIVGESGSGKSTVIALLERFYDPSSGTILLDDVDIREFQIGWYRQQLGLVSQEPIVFNDTVKANIIYGRQGSNVRVTDEEIEAAAKSANAHKFIVEMPDGYNTLVGERGTQLSGGQKQRVAIARAIIKDPKLLLLDEATSALDAESERVVQDALDRVMIGRTTVIIAHRLSTIKSADIIAVVKNGRIVEQGRHEELISKPNGTYATLANLHRSAT